MKAVNTTIIIIVKWINLELKTKEAPPKNNLAILKSQTSRATKMFVLFYMTLDGFGMIFC